MSINDSSSARIRWGILGTGAIADAFATDLRLTGHRIVAAGSRTAERAAAFASRFGIGRSHGSYEALVADAQVDIVYVATPHVRHYEDAALALNAGKHVLVEKPFTINAAEARALAELATEKRLVLLEAMWTRWLPHMVEIRKLVAGGQIGEVRAVIADHSQQMPEDPLHRINALELGGGALLDLGVYPISLASDMLGTPSTVDARATFKPTGADAETAITLRYPGGRTASIFTASDLAGPTRAAILGTAGRIEIDTMFFTPTPFHVYDADRELVLTHASHVEGHGMQFQAEEAERLIIAGRLQSDVLPLAESIAIMETMDEVRRQVGLRYPHE